MAELDCLLDDEFFDSVGNETHWYVGEVFIERIEPGETEPEILVPLGYEENGIWVRGDHDHAHPRVAGAIGTGRSSTMVAFIGEATWIERRMPLIDAARQTDAVRISEGYVSRGEEAGWRAVDENRYFRYVSWIGARGDYKAPRSAPPLRMRLRCWHDVVIELPRGRRVVLREEGLRGDDERTASRAIERWRTSRGEYAARLVTVRDIRISKRQPRPMLPKQSA